MPTDDKIDFGPLKLEACDFCENMHRDVCPKQNPHTLESYCDGVEFSRKEDRVIHCDCFIIRFRKTLQFLSRLLTLLSIGATWTKLALLLVFPYWGTEFGASDMIWMFVFAALAAGFFCLSNWLDNMKGAVKKSVEINRLYMQETPVPAKKAIQRKGTAKKTS